MRARETVPPEAGLVGGGGRTDHPRFRRRSARAAESRELAADDAGTAARIPRGDLSRRRADRDRQAKLDPENNGFGRIGTPKEE